MLISNAPLVQTNTLRYLRTHARLSIEDLSRITKVSMEDIGSIEKNNIHLGLCKIAVLADFFDVSIDSLLSPSMDYAMLTRNAPSKRTPYDLSNLSPSELRKKKVGEAGEIFVLEEEREKLKDTVYLNGINPNYHLDINSHFDILSYDTDKMCPLFIEVKTTTYDDFGYFNISRAEFDTAKELTARGYLYEIHRVVNVFNKENRTRVIISSAEFSKYYNVEPHSYIVNRKVVIA